ncbi:DUF2975 domain-containing protein [Streptacidiphilus sp. MAP5-3]|uniref:DUF2975 domain-containing protein n=1 Tax=unclassified Streptacidiphilus TaxID=2643834 RepID=UPI0035161384
MALVVLAGLLAVLGLNNFYGWGTPSPACLDAPADLLHFQGSGAALAGLHTNGTSFAETFNVCAQHPSTGQTTLRTVAEATPMLFLLLGLALVVRLLDSAHHEGVYSLKVARRLRILGWSLIGGELATSFAQAIANRQLLASLTQYHLGFSAVMELWHLSWVLLLVGIGVLTFARIVRTGHEMRAELDGVI